MGRRNIKRDGMADVEAHWRPRFLRTLRFISLAQEHILDLVLLATIQCIRPAGGRVGFLAF